MRGRIVDVNQRPSYREEAEDGASEGSLYEAKCSAVASSYRMVSSRRWVAGEQSTWSRWIARWMVEAPVTELELQKVQCNEVALLLWKVRTGGLARQTRSGAAGT
jgi:hypothetical protein